MEKNVKCFVMLLVMVLCLNNFELSVYASDYKLNNSENFSWESLIGDSMRTYYDDETSDEAITDSVIALWCPQNHVEIKEAYMAEFIDVIALTDKNEYINISRIVDADYTEKGIVEYYNGRVKALKKGSTILKLSYKDLICSVEVTVKDDAFDSMHANVNVGNSAGTNSVPGVDYSTVMGRASAMINVTWVAKKKFMLNDGTTAYAGTTLKGVPYSQKVQCNAAEFINYYNSGLTNGFYDLIKRGSHYDAAYGVDCSGFVSKAWGIPRSSTDQFVSELYSGTSTKYEKIGSYSLLSSNDTTGISNSVLISAYANLTATCALVYREPNKGHAMLVAANNPNVQTCTIYEAKNNFPEIVTYTYAQLANWKYIPFTVKTSYYNAYN